MGYGQDQSVVKNMVCIKGDVEITKNKPKKQASSSSTSSTTKPDQQKMKDPSKDATPSKSTTESGPAKKTKA